MSSLPFPAILVVLLAAGVSTDAKLASTKAQEAAMVKIAASIGEKWRASPLSDPMRGNDSVTAEIADTRKKIAEYEGGILGDMNIAGDVAAMLVCARTGDARNIIIVNGFDSAALKLNTGDRIRYFCAKGLIHAGFVKSGVSRDSILIWLDHIVSDYTGAVANGYEVKKGIGFIRRQLEDAGLKDLFLDEYSCRMYQASVPWSIREVQSLHAARKGKEALDLALKTVRDLPRTTSLKPGDCSNADPGGTAAAYAQKLIFPLAKSLGGASESFLIRVCIDAWNEKPLTAMLLPQLRTPAKETFELFRKAGEDDDLKADRAIAIAEVAVWKKAGRLKQFRTQYPQRYALAVPMKKGKK